MKKLHQLHRKKLMAALPDSLILLVSSHEAKRNSDVDYLFRQDSDFLYLSGITEPHHAIILDAKNQASHLFIPDTNTLHQIWMGKQLTKDAAKKYYGFDHTHYLSEFKTVFLKLKKGHKKFHALKNTAAFFRKHKTAARFEAKPLRVALNELRVRKSPDEIKLMQHANAISKIGHIAAMQATKPGVSEFIVQAALEKEFLAGGALHQAYPAIVASGNNAAILHYHSHNAPCKNGDFLLIDAGCEINGYAADITRTFPVNGKFSKIQRDIYEIVLATQKDCIRMVRPGISVADLHRQACHTITQGLMDLGFYKLTDIKEIIEKELHRYFFPHGIGHMLGLDVHDVGGRDPNAKPERNKQKYLRTARKLEAGMVVTVEPGIYFIDAHFDSKETRKKTAQQINWARASEYRSVGGIRIEDDIVVTAKGHFNLTSVPKEITDIEKIMKKSA